VNLRETQEGSEAVDRSVIGISGVARVGKDTFTEALIHLFATEGFEAQRVAFADALKEDINDFLLAKTGVNAYTSNTEEKALLRPMLVEYGRLMRSLTDGQYWINIVKEKIEKNTKNNIISIVSDARYKNEMEWVNSQSHSASIHLSRKGIEAANSEEEENDPQAKLSANYSIHWRNCDSEKEVINQVEKYFYGLDLPSKFIRPRVNRADSGPKKLRSTPQRIS